MGASPGVGELLGLNQNISPGTQLAALLNQRAEPGAVEQMQRVLIASASEQGHASVSVAVPAGEQDSRQVQIELTVLRDGEGGFLSMVALCRAVAGDEAGLPAVGMRVSNGEGSGGTTQIRRVDGQEFIVASPLMHKFMGLVERVAGHTETVLITGETGVGKELIARTIHHSSHRRSRPWVDVNCAALPDNLVESELFGYEKGAFSGADTPKAGMFELADKGTLFLDEIGELQPHIQVKLLRVLDGHPFYRLGGSRKIHVDVRVVAATNQDLEAAVASGRFRRDLYHRLSQFQLHVPPLRERVEDVAALAESILAAKVPSRTLTPGAQDALQAHAWPGNVRELRNVLAKACVDASQAAISEEDIMCQLRGAPGGARAGMTTVGCDLDSVEEQTILSALEQTGGHRARAAEKLGISRRTLSRKLKEYNVGRSHGSQASLGLISIEQQKFFRARVEVPATIRNARGDEARVQGVNLSTGGMGLDGVPPAMRTAEQMEVTFPLPESEEVMTARARIVWAGEGGRVGVRFTEIAPQMLDRLQTWTVRKMKEEGWELPAG